MKEWLSNYSIHEASKLDGNRAQEFPEPGMGFNPLRQRCATGIGQHLARMSTAVCSLMDTTGLIFYHHDIRTLRHSYDLHEVRHPETIGLERQHRQSPQSDQTADVHFEDGVPLCSTTGIVAQGLLHNSIEALCLLWLEELVLSKPLCHLCSPGTVRPQATFSM
jgi:hypothetical protein